MSEVGMAVYLVQTQAYTFRRIVSAVHYFQTGLHESFQLRKGPFSGIFQVSLRHLLAWLVIAE